MLTLQLSLQNKPIVVNVRSISTMFRSNTIIALHYFIM